MRGSVSLDATLELKHRAGIAPYQKRLRGLTQKGAQWSAKCPFHADKTPSFSIYPAKDDPNVLLFSCHPCSKHGDVLKFIELADKVPFKQALETLRTEVGVKAESPKSTEEPSFKIDQAAAIKRLPEIAKFLESRGISMAVAEQAGLGAVNYPGLGLAVTIPYGVKSASDVPVYKIRAINPPTDSDGRVQKFRHIKGAPSDDLLYGFEALRKEALLNPEVWVTESELDACMLRSHGLNAVSVSSATSSLDKEGKLKYDESVFKELCDIAEQIFIVTDMDEPGDKNWAAWSKQLPEYKTFRVRWQFRGKDSGDAKDVGDLYKQDPAGFYDKLLGLAETAVKNPPWRSAFLTGSQLADGEIKMLIKGILPEGVTFLGSLSGVGKTWLALSMAKALTTHKPFLGTFEVPEQCNVLYLVPEMGDRSLRQRLERLGMPMDEWFYCQTLRDGVCDLKSADLLAAIRNLKPVVFLDTAIRFRTGADENSSSENQMGLASVVLALVRAGAPSVICLHHSPKSSGASDNITMTLENVLRGTGDFGAMCDAVWGIAFDKKKDGARWVDEYTEESRNLTRLFVMCVKPRDFEPVDPFRIQGRPYIDEQGDFVILSGEVENEPVVADTRFDQAIGLLTADPKTSLRKLVRETGISLQRLRTRLGGEGWCFDSEQGLWVHSNVSMES